MNYFVVQDSDGKYLVDSTSEKLDIYVEKFDNWIDASVFASERNMNYDFAKYLYRKEHLNDFLKEPQEIMKLKGYNYCK